MYPKPSFGDTFGWSKGACNAFSGARVFSLLLCRLVRYLGLLVNSEHRGSSCMWGCVKAPLGISLVPKAFLWGHFWMGEWGLKRFFCVPSFQSSAMLARVIFRLLVNSEHVGSSCVWACIKAPLGSSDVPKAFLWGQFLWANGARNTFSVARAFS